MDFYHENSLLDQMQQLDTVKVEAHRLFFNKDDGGGTGEKYAGKLREILGKDQDRNGQEGGPDATAIAEEDLGQDAGPALPEDQDTPKRMTDDGSQDNFQEIRAKTPEKIDPGPAEPAKPKRSNKDFRSMFL
jgi:hypothetical protein